MSAEQTTELIPVSFLPAKVDCGRRADYATHTLFLIEPPSIDAGEITDKGYLNQRAVLERRAELVDQLYAASLSAEVIVNR